MKSWEGHSGRGNSSAKARSREQSPRESSRRDLSTELRGCGEQVAEWAGDGRGLAGDLHFILGFFKGMASVRSQVESRACLRQSQPFLSAPCRSGLSPEPRRALVCRSIGQTERFSGH